MSARPGRPRAAAARRRGFSVVEVLVATTLSLLVVTAAVALFVNQTRAYLRVRGMAAVQRDLRLGIALLPMDLRAASRRDGDLLALNETSIELFATIGGSVICEATGLLKTGLTLPPANMAPVAFTNFYTAPQAGDVVKVLIRRQQGGDTDFWLTGQVAGGLTPSSSAAQRLCAGATAETGTSPRLSLPITWPTVPLTTDLDVIRPGMPVRVLRRVRYSLYQEGSGRWYLGYAEWQPSGTWGTRTPIAGPYEAAVSGRSGVRFAYFDTLNTALAAPVVGTNIGRIDITLRPRAQVRAGSGTRADSVVVRDSAVVRVALRNRL